MNKIIRQFVLASALLVAIGVAPPPPPPLISGINTAHAQTDTTKPTVDLGTIDVGVIGTQQSHLFAFSERVTGLTRNDFSASTDVTVTAVTSSAGSGRRIYTVLIIPRAASFTLTLAADSVVLASNTSITGPASEVSVTGTATVRDTAPTADFRTIAPGVIGTQQRIILTFSERVTGLTTDDFSTSTGATVDDVSDASRVYDILFTPTAAEFTLTLAANSVMDEADTPNDGPPSDVSVDGTAVLSADANLSSLTISAGTLSPEFDAATLGYTVNVANDVASTTVTPTTNNDGASVTVDGTAVASTATSGAIDLAIGANAIAIVVTAADTTEQTYTVTVRRAPAAPSLALAADTGSLPDDRITNNGRVNVTGLESGAAWRYTVNGGAVSPTFTTGTGTFFTLDEGDYAVDQVQVVQSLGGADSLPTSLAAVTVDETAPEITLNGDDVVRLIVGDPYTERNATATDNVDGSVTPTTGGETVLIDAAGVYFVTYDAVDAAGNEATQVQRTVYVNEPASMDADLVSLTITDNNNAAVTLDPTFDADADTVDYTASVDNEVTSVTVTAGYKTGTGTQTVTVNMISVDDEEASDPITLAVGVAKAIAIVVTAQDGITTKTYTVTVTRAAPASTNADLSGLTISAGTLPTFAAATEGYAVNVGNDVASITVTPTVADDGASVTVDGVMVVSGATSAAITLAVGVAKAIAIVVTAEDGSTTKTYTVTVTRAAPATLSSDADLSGLTISAGTLPAFATATENYAVSVDNDVASITLTPTTNNDGATLTVDGTAVTSGATSAAITLTAGVAKAIAIVVTAEDSTTTKTYTVTVTRAAPATLSTDADLSGLTISAGTLPTFATGTEDYAVDVDNDVASITVTPTVADDGASVTVDGSAVASGAASGAIALAVGVAKAIAIVVTATDGITTKTYTVSVTRAAPATLSTDADLATLSITDNNGNPVTPNEAIAPDTLTYTATAPSDTTSVTITVTAADSNAEVDLDSLGTNTENFGFRDEMQSFAIEITAEDGTTKKLYRLTITRAAPVITNTAPSIQGSGAVNYAENGAGSVATYTATDDENNTITWEITGTDAGDFTIGETSGVLTFNTAPDYETQSTYSVIVHATETDGVPSNLTDELAVTITLTNVDEDGAIGAITGSVQVGQTLTAGEVTDPDGGVSGITYQWQGDSTDINSATSATYTPGVADIGKTIRVVATYTDGEGSGKEVTSAPTAAVEAADVILSMDADLSSLTIADNDGTAVALDPTFDAATLDYTADVDNDVASVMLTPTTSDTAASVTVAGTAVTSATASSAITLNVGANAIAIVVTAQNGTEKTYTVTIDRGANTAPRITTAATQSVAENTPTTTPVVTFAADDDESNTITWALTGADAGDFTLNAASGALTLNALPNYETKRSYAVTVTATDNGTPNMPSAPRAVTIAVTNVDEEGSVVIGGDLLVGATLTATVTEEDGAASLTYQWQSAGADGVYADITSATSATYILAATDAGKTLQVVAMYNDGFGDKTVTSTITGAVPAAPVTTNQPPVANAGALQTVAIGATVTLDGSGSTDSDGTIQSYEWVHTSTDGVAPTTTITVANGETSTFTAPDAAADLDLVFTLTVTDDDGATNINTDTNTVTITVTAPVADNQPPVANAGDLQTVAIGATVTLDGSGSTDSDGTIQSYVWVHTSTDGVAPTTPITVANGETSTFTAPDAAADLDLVFTLTVTDDGGATNINTDTNTVTITVTAPVVTTPFAVTIPDLGKSTVGNRASVGIDFGRAVTGLAIGDFTVSNGAVNSIAPAAGSGTTFVVTYTPSTAGAVTLTLAANAVTDGDGNPNLAATSEPGTAAPAENPTQDDPDMGRFVASATRTIPDLTTAEFDEDDFKMGIADELTRETEFIVEESNVNILSIAAGSVVVVYEVVGIATTEAERDELVRVLVGDDSTAVAEVILSGVARAIADQNISAIAGRVERARTQPNGTGFNFAGQQMLFGGNANANANGGGANAGNSMSSTLDGMITTHAQALADDTLDMKTLLGNSDFSIVIPAQSGIQSGYEPGLVGNETGISLISPISQTNYATAPIPGTLTFWGSGDYRNLSGEDDDLTLDWDGDLFSLHLGVDAHITAGVIGGVALSWSEGEMDYTTTAGSGKKTYDTRMTSINPYFSWGNAHGAMWMTAGYGEGELERDIAGTTSSNDLSMQTFAIGGNSILLRRGADTLRLKGEISQSVLEVDANKDGSGLSEMEVDANRARLSLESTNTITRDNGARTDRKVELGARHDGGDGVTGTGIELGLGLRHSNASGLSVEGKLRALLGHEGDINEWGISGTIKQSAGADGQGFSFALSPGYGDDASDLQRLWEHGLRDVDGNASSDTTDPDGNADPDTARDYSARLDARIGYGINGFTALGSGSGLLTPYTSMTLSDNSNRYRLGVQWKLGERLDFDLLGEREDATNADDNKILLKGEFRF